MSSALSFALVVAPLVVYLYVVAVWQSSARPEVVRGWVDLAALLFGLSGLVVFGPIGQALLERVTFAHTTGFGPRLALLGSLALLATPWLPAALRRLIVYNAEPDTVQAALRAALERLPGEFVPTLRGYEDQAGKRGLHVETTTWSRATVVEGYGTGARTLIAQVRAELLQRLPVPRRRPATVAWVLLFLCLALLVPLFGTVLSRPQTREMLRVLLNRLQGG